MRAAGRAVWEGIAHAGEAVGSATAPARREAWRQARAAQYDWIAQGVRGPQQVRAPSGVGGFEVSYDPITGVEHVRIGAAVDFVDGMRLEGDKVVPAHENFAKAAAALAKGPDRARALKSWRWDESEKGPWLRKMKEQVEEAWTRRFQFHCALPWWEDLVATNRVVIEVRAGRKGPGDHVAVTAFRTPDDRAGDVGVLQSGRGGPADNRMDLTSSDNDARLDNLLVAHLPPFEPGSAALSKAQVAAVTTLTHRFRAGSRTPPPVRLFCRATGKRAHALARRRFEALRGLFLACGLEAGRVEYEFAGEGEDATFQLAGGWAQNVAAHEFGHQLGLLDQYATDLTGGLDGTGALAGQPSGDDRFFRSLGLPGSVHENSDSIMSVGASVRPVHGATLLWALRQVTSLSAWASGPGKPVAPPPDLGGRGEGKGGR